MDLGSSPAVDPRFTPPPAPDAVQVVARTPALAEVRIVLVHGQPAAAIGTVRLENDAWRWVHSDGEQSSPIASTRLAAATALAEYHRAYKPPPKSASLRQRLDEARVRQ
jgi:hypothetical protein